MTIGESRIVTVDVKGTRISELPDVELRLGRTILLPNSSANGDNTGNCENLVPK